MSAKSDDPVPRIGLAALIVIGVGIALFNLISLFRPLFTARESEATGAIIVFFFLAIMPWVGLVVSALGKRPGAWILICSPLLALPGLVLTDLENVRQFLIIVAIYFVPTFLTGLILLRAIDALHRDASPLAERSG